MSITRYQRNNVAVWCIVHDVHPRRRDEGTLINFILVHMLEVGQINFLTDFTFTVQWRK